MISVLRLSTAEAYVKNVYVMHSDKLGVCVKASFRS
jgi:hypothetical protein